MRRARVRAGLVSALTIALALPVGDAAAGETTSKEALAESLFQDARKLLAAGNVAEACRKFKASLDVDHAGGTLTALAFCHQKEGRTASAWAEFTEAAMEAKRAGRSEQEKYALKQLAALEKVLRRVVITVPAVTGLAVTIDDVDVPAAALGSPIPVDPGSRRFGASAPHRVPTSLTVELPPGPGTTEVSLPAPAEAAPPPPPPTPSPSPPLLAPAPAEAPSRTPALLLGGGVALAGAAVLGFGAYYQFVVARRQEDDAVYAVREQYDPETSQQKYDAAKTSSAIGISSMAVGAVGVGVGAYLLVAALRAPAPADKKHARRPMLVPTRDGLLLVGDL